MADSRSVVAFDQDLRLYRGAPEGREQAQMSTGVGTARAPRALWAWLAARAVPTLRNRAPMLSPAVDAAALTRSSLGGGRRVASRFSDSTRAILSIEDEP